MLLSKYILVLLLSFEMVLLIANFDNFPSFSASPLSLHTFWLTVFNSLQRNKSRITRFNVSCVELTNDFNLTPILCLYVNLKL